MRDSELVGQLHPFIPESVNLGTAIAVDIGSTYRLSEGLGHVIVLGGQRLAFIDRMRSFPDHLYRNLPNNSRTLMSSISSSMNVHLVVSLIIVVL